MGHFMRQLNIATEMKHRGFEVTLAISDYKPAAYLLDKNKLLYVKSNKVPFEIEPKAETDIIILDIGNTNIDYTKRLKQNGIKVISFDDQGSGRDYVDLLVDSNLEPSDFSKSRSLFGAKYIVIDNSFSLFHNLEKKIAVKIEKVAISMGGTDPRCIGPEIACFLLKSGIDFKIDLISGAGFDDNEIKSDYTHLIKNSRNKCRVYKNLSNLAEVFYNADLVICAGGITLYEACALGTPALVISQVPLQQKKSLKVQKWGAAVNLGMWKESVLIELLQTINSLDAIKRKKMSIAGKEMVDGKGLQRVIKEIEKL